MWPSLHATGFELPPVSPPVVNVHNKNRCGRGGGGKAGRNVFINKMNNRSSPLQLYSDGAVFLMAVTLVLYKYICLLFIKS